MKTTLRILTCGSVDDGKSTLIGRLLVDAGLVKLDQAADVDAAGMTEDGKLAAFCDGLLEEREKGITIDVAHRYFETKRHKYIINDCPGHAEFQQNMSTGCSTSDVAIIMLDSTRPIHHCITEQTVAHFRNVGLFAIPKVLVCINKLDKHPAETREHVFKEISKQVRTYMKELLPDKTILSFFPVSALTGANVVHSDTEMFPWWESCTLFEKLEDMDPPVNELNYQEPIAVVDGFVTGPNGKAAVWVKVVSGTIEKGSVLYVDGTPHTVTVDDIAVGNTDFRLMATTGTSCSLFISGETYDAIQTGSVLTTEDSDIAPEYTLDLNFIWLSEKKLDKTKPIGVIVHGQKRIASVVEIIHFVPEIPDCFNIKYKKGVGKGYIGIMNLAVTTPIVTLPYYYDRHPLGQVVLYDLDTYETVGVGMVRLWDLQD